MVKTIRATCGADLARAHLRDLGDTKSTITHPATTTHWRLTSEERDRVEITDGLIRISAGLEDADDLWRDLEQALAMI